MTHPNAAVIDRLYTSFRNLDPDTMASCYADDVEFEDEAFVLHGKREVVGMWTMLCGNVKASGRDDWKLSFDVLDANGDSGRAHWEPIYRFSATGRLVHNVIDAEFGFRDGLIVRQRDRFDFWRWSRQALGPAGLLLGWSPMLRNKVRRNAGDRLHVFLSRTSQESG